MIFTFVKTALACVFILLVLHSLYDLMQASVVTPKFTDIVRKTELKYVEVEKILDSTCTPT